MASAAAGLMQLSAHAWGQGLGTSGTLHRFRVWGFIRFIAYGFRVNMDDWC